MIVPCMPVIALVTGLRLRLYGSQAIRLRNGLGIKESVEQDVERYVVVLVDPENGRRGMPQGG